MYLRYEQIAVTGAIFNVSSLNIPAGATGAELLADTQNVRYTMDDVTNPIQTRGMILKVADEPKSFGIDDIQRIRFTRGAASDAVLNVHYFGGRDI